MSKVIVLEPTSLVLKEAETFGELIYISNVKFNIFNIDDMTQRINNKLKEIEYKPLDDLICLLEVLKKLHYF